jgi:regulator of cell morphogenesis and NO signaling
MASSATTQSPISGAESVRLPELVNYQQGSIVSRVLLKREKGNVTLFAFDEGQGLSEHTVPFDALHGKNHPELEQMRAVFQSLAQELRMHMMKEEMMLFPYIVRMEEAVIQKEPVLPPPFGSVQNPVSMMEHEHDDTGEALRALREITSGYAAPADACISYQTLYRALAEFEADLHQHIHLENNLLFPRAIAMERAHS